MGIYFSKPENEPVPRPPNNELALDEEICQSLIGKYKLLHEYDYVLIDNNNDDEFAKNKAINNSLKSKTIKGYWDAQKCIRDEKGDMTLRGIDESVHAVTVRIGDKNILVTELVRKLDSIVSFDRKGKIYRRRLEIDSNYKIKENKAKRTSSVSDFSNAIQKDIIQAIDRYKIVIFERHAHGTQHSCYSAIGEKNRKNLVISFCPIDKQDKFPLYYRGMLECSGEHNCKSFFDDPVYE
ncbi:MAG: hypothetical protein H0V39_00325 [Nitrosomonas sp.]|nr:hypothetical protein [Nitrosomonas sp.]MBA3971738.1 hypothetical protein [Bacteroidota bacterium]